MGSQTTSIVSPQSGSYAMLLMAERHGVEAGFVPLHHMPPRSVKRTRLMDERSSPADIFPSMRDGHDAQEHGPLQRKQTWCHRDGRSRLRLTRPCSRVRSRRRVPPVGSIWQRVAGTWAIGDSGQQPCSMLGTATADSERFLT